MSRPAPRLLLISPAFHGYWRGLEAAFSSLGYAVQTYRYDEHATLTAKLRVKASELGGRLPGRTGQHQHGAESIDERATAGALTALAQANPDRVLLIKADSFGSALWERLAARGRPYGLWLYDEVRRTRHTPQTLTRAGALASYSPKDVADLRAAGHEVTWVPGGFDASVAATPRSTPEVVFIGARYPNRERLLNHLQAAGIPVRAYGRDWSGHPLDRLRTWRVGSPAVPAARDIPRAEAYGLMAGARASLNVHHDQDGFTMRTFETPGVGGFQLLDRADVSAFYEPGTEVAVFSSPEEAVDLARRAAVDRAWADRIRARGQARTLAEHTFVHRARALESLWA